MEELSCNTPYQWHTQQVLFTFFSQMLLTHTQMNPIGPTVNNNISVKETQACVLVLFSPFIKYIFTKRKNKLKNHMDCNEQQWFHKESHILNLSTVFKNST